MSSRIGYGTPMRTLSVFNHVSVDGYFVDAAGDMGWAHKSDPEWDAFASNNASGGGVLMFGRVTYDMMASFWPTPMAAQMLPVVAERMNTAAKIVFSKTMTKAAWTNTEVIGGDIVAAVRELKQTEGPDIVILGSGSIVAQLTQARLIDGYQLVINPIVLGAGRTLFAGVRDKLPLQLVSSRQFHNGNVVLTYQLGK